MEEEITAALHRSPSTKTSRPLPSSSTRSPPEQYAAQTPTATSSLRFPTPEGSHLLAHWVTSSSTGATDTMQPSNVSDETNSLADSAYELISSTDGESQDGRGTESVVDSLADSVDLYPRGDDVRSLNGHDTTYGDDADDHDDDESVFDDGQDRNRHHGANQQQSRVRSTPRQSRLYGEGHEIDDEDNDGGRSSSQADSIRYAEEALRNPSTQSLPTLEYDGSSGDISSGSAPLVQSIEFIEEAEVNVYLEKVSVKHTIRDFTEDETSIIAENMGMAAGRPKRLAATIRQTMSHHCLSTREPLRVLYVGSDAGYNDIMYKISSALLASAPSSSRAGRDSRHHHTPTPSIYNIMPISSFGSTKVPEIDEIQLMGVSEYYIKVERCTKADETVYEGEAFPNDTVYSITLDSEKTYLSVFSPSGSIVSPRWVLPHVAVFYVSGNDDRQAQTTRNAAWEFMTRHAVPSIFISHKQSFSRSPSAGRWQDFVDQAAVHLCLESRDPDHHIAPERLPIDLVSFLNIDARQMNRNLAYLTGLHDTTSETSKTEKPARDLTTSGIGGIVQGLAGYLRFLSKGSAPRPEMYRTYREVSDLLSAPAWKTLIIATVSALLWSCVVLYGPALLSTTSTSPSAAALLTPKSSSLPASVSSASSQIFASVVSSATSGSASSICSVPSLTPTVTISLTSTKTVEVHVSESSSHTTQAHFGGFLTDRAHHQTQKGAGTTSDTEIKSTGCLIQVYSSHEILVKVPSGTKTTWLAKGAIDIDVWRGQKILKSKLSTTDEGIIIEINKKDAYGVMNVSIVTTRRPKINETFAVDFGKPTVARLVEAGSSLWRDSLEAIIHSGRDAAAYAGETVTTYARDMNKAALPLSAEDAMEHAAALLFTARSELESHFDSATQAFHWMLNATERTSQNVAGQFKVLAGRAAGKVAHDAQTLVRRSVDKAAEEARAILGRAAQQMTPVDLLRDNVRLSVLRAQIASNLWWLRVQGKMAEHADYAAKSSEFLRQKELAAESKAGSRESTPKTDAQKPVREAPAAAAAWFWRT